MSVFQRIVVGVDGSDPSNAAVALAVRVACDTNESEIVFCFVLDVDDDYRVAAASESTIGGDELVHEDRRTGRAYLDAAERTASAAGVRTVGEILTGDPGKTLTQFASDGRFDLLVVGTHGRNGIQRMFLGSTAETVLRHATVPVLTIKASCAARVGDGIDATSVQQTSP